MSKPIVAVVGRPNVGKSTLFNRIAGRRIAVVHDQPGVTRDRLYVDCTIKNRHFVLADTGGLDMEYEFGDKITPKVVEQSMAAIEEASVIIFVMDIKAGHIPVETEICRSLQKTKKPVIYVLNKADGPRDETLMADFYDLGVENFYPVSAQHKRGLYELDDAIVEALPSKGTFGEHSAKSGYTHIAIVGRPNVGKSSMVNSFVGDERVVVTDVPGTTRDPIDTEIRYRGKSYVLVDTAGIRRRGKIVKALERDSVFKAKESLRRSHVAAIIVDGEEGITDQDARIAGMALDSSRGCIIVVNKWDLVEKDTNTAKKYEEIKRFHMKFLEFAPVLFVSALTRQRLFKILDMADKIRANWEKHIETPKLNQALEGWLLDHSPPLVKGKTVKIFYITQVRNGPPTFVLFMNRSEDLHFSYQRYLINKIRDTFDFYGCPIRLITRQRKQK